MPMDFSSKLNFNLDFHIHREKIKISEYTALYLTHTIRALAVSLVGIFLPIYIFTISGNYMLFHHDPVINGLSWILSYFLLRSVFTWVAIMFLGNLIFSKIHFQLSMVISFVFLIAEILLWFLAKGNLFLILLAGVLAGFKVTLYWIPYHIFFVRKSGNKKQQFGKRTSMRFFLIRIISGIGPAIGGLIILNYGFNALFMSSILLLVVASLPIALIIHEWEHRKHNVVNVIEKYLLNPKYLKLNLAYIGSSMDNIIYSIFWPILLFLILDNFVKIGFLNSFSFLVSSATVLIIGRFIDKHGTKVVHGIGAFLNSLLYIPRMIFSNAFLFYALDISDRLIMGTYTLPEMALSYQKARKIDGSDFIIFRELSTHVGIILTATVSLIALQFTQDWRLLFSLAMIGSLLSYFIETDKN